jgi:hypothetical protein
MKTLPQNAELLAVAERAVWYKKPAEAVADSLNFTAHVLTYGTAEDVRVLRRYIDLEDIRDAIDHAPPGVFDVRSWAYWNVMIGRDAPPPMPQRVLPDP